MKLFMSVLLLCSLSWAGTINVATTGSDNNTGTQSSPVATLQQAYLLAVNGDTILVNDGTYVPNFNNPQGGFLVNIQSKTGLTFKPVNRRAVILDLQFKAYSAFYCGAGASGITIQGFIIRNAYWGGIAANSGGCKNLTVQDNHFGPICSRNENSQVGCFGIYTDTAATGKIDANEFERIGRTNDNNSTNAHDHGVYTHGNFTISNNTFIPYNGWAIQTAEGFSGSILNNSFTGPVQFGGKLGQIELWGSNPTVTIANNLSTGSRGTFIDRWQGNIGTCRVYNNSVTGAALGAGPGTTVPECVLSGPTPYGPVGPQIEPVVLDIGVRVTNLELKLCGYAGTGCAPR